MKIDPLLNKLLDWSMIFNVRVAICLQVSDICKRDVEKPKDDVRALAVDGHDIVGPKYHNHKRNKEEQSKYYYRSIITGIYRQFKLRYCRVNTVIEVVKHQFSLVGKETLIIKVDENEPLHPNQPRLQTHPTSLIVIILHIDFDTGIEGDGMVLSNKSIVSINLCCILII